jgi:hypothetical protein
MTLETIFRIDWTERERGWGARPDGHTYFPTKEAAEQAIKDHWAKYPDAVNGRAPDYYISPSEPRASRVAPGFAERVRAEGSVFDPG